MKVIDKVNSKITKDGLGVGLGNFDGLHIGHMSLLSALITECEKRKLKSLLYTFFDHPENVLSKNRRATPQIITTEKKTELLRRTNIDYVLLEIFDKSYAKMSPEIFVKKILVDMLKVKFVVIGFNYTFGYKGSGSVEDMQAFAEKYGFDCIVVLPIKIGREIISSTLVRKYIKQGSVNRARICLGRYYSIYGVVQLGRQIGTSIGFPTANIIPEDHLVLPKSGVYVTCTVLDGQIYDSITNVGSNPTFGELEKVICETHIFEREGNLYGKRIEVLFMAKLREEIKFESKEDLCNQINMDIIAAREFFACESRRSKTERA